MRVAEVGDHSAGDQTVEEGTQSEFRGEARSDEHQREGDDQRFLRRPGGSPEEDPGAGSQHDRDPGTQEQLDQAQPGLDHDGTIGIDSDELIAETEDQDRDGGTQSASRLHQLCQFAAARSEIWTKRSGLGCPADEGDRERERREQDGPERGLRCHDSPPSDRHRRAQEQRDDGVQSDPSSEFGGDRREQRSTQLQSDDESDPRQRYVKKWLEGLRSLSIEDGKHPRPDHDPGDHREPATGGEGRDPSVPLEPCVEPGGREGRGDPDQRDAGEDRKHPGGTFTGFGEHRQGDQGNGSPSRPRSPATSVGRAG